MEILTVSSDICKFVFSYQAFDALGTFGLQARSWFYSTHHHRYWVIMVVCKERGKQPN
jgi:hypothetical protein